MKRYLCIIFLVYMTITLNAQTTKMIKVYGYGTAQMLNKQLAVQRAKNQALNNIAAQVNGADFTFTKADKSVSLTIIQPDTLIQGAITNDILEIASGLWLVTMSTITEVAIVDDENAGMYMIKKKVKAKKNKTLDITRVLADIKKDALIQYMKKYHPDQQTITGKIYLNGLTIKSLNKRGDLRIEAQLYIVM